MITGGLTSIGTVEHYRIDGVEEMRPFLTTVVSDSDLWMFVSSTGALTAGRVDADGALFPYATDDLIHRAAGDVGPVTVVARFTADGRDVWRPFRREPTPGCTRSIAKSAVGDRLVFEERNEAWGLLFRSTWAPSPAYGWVRTVELVDLAGAGHELEVLDGLVDVMPAGVEAPTEQIRSNLVDAYKRAELVDGGPCVVYHLESLVTDRAEPAESLRASVVWSTGFDGAEIHLSADAVAAAAGGHTLTPERRSTGRPGAYLLRGAISVAPEGSSTWSIVADTGLDHRGVLGAVSAAADPAAAELVADDVAAGSQRLEHLLAGADGFQTTADDVADAHHLSNVLFNSMRGGVFPFDHRVRRVDLAVFVSDRNRAVAERHAAWLDALPAEADVTVLRSMALDTGDEDLVRLVLEYLPLTFSRRHGDPSRPWNKFSIHVRDADGAELLAYEGNWRDIFQNWEALLRSYPAYFAHVVAKFVNASTLDGHNPYRISHDGVDWEFSEFCTKRAKRRCAFREVNYTP